MPLQQLASMPDGADTPAASRMGPVAALDYDAATSTLFTGTKEGFALWAVKSSNLGCWGRCVGQIKDLNVAPTSVAWANSSREILAGFSNGSVIIYDVDLGEATYALPAHKDEVTSIMWLDAPRRLLTASKDKTLKIWDFPSLRRISLEDQVANVVAPTVSLAPCAQPRDSSGSRPASGAGRGARLPIGNPLAGARRGAAPSGGYPADAGNSTSTASAANTSYSSTADPLGRATGRSADTASTMAAESSATSRPPLISADGPLGAADGLGASSLPPSDPIGDSLRRPARAVDATSQAPRGSGAKPTSLVRSDSDDDLVGWDS